MSGSYAGSPNTKYLYYSQGMEDITLKDPLLPASINQELIIRSLIIYRNLIPLPRYLMKNNPALSVDNPGPQETKYLLSTTYGGCHPEGLIVNIFHRPE